jgi:hypothetical protein
LTHPQLMKTAGATKQRHAVCPPSSTAPAAACASCTAAATRGGKLKAPAAGSHDVTTPDVRCIDASYHLFRQPNNNIIINLPLGDGYLQHPISGDFFEDGLLLGLLHYMTCYPCFMQEQLHPGY